ncbi:hypothetical protein [Paraconexibacter sp. AEG42_29]
MRTSRRLALPFAVVALAASGCGEEIAEVRQSVDSAQNAVQTAKAAIDAFDNGGAVAAAQRAFGDVADIKGLTNVRCPTSGLRVDGVTLRVDCVGDIANGRTVTVPLTYTPGDGFQTGTPRIVPAGG